MALDLEALSLTEIIQLQTQLSENLKRRFEKHQALVFTDVVGSTAYFARFGDQAGRGLQQRHLDLLKQVLEPHHGRIVDTAGDGAFSCFQLADGAADGVIQLQELITAHNGTYAREHQLSIRAGIHWGTVLTDGNLVTGDSVNLCARVAGTGQPGEIRITRAAFLEISRDKRLRCRGLNAQRLKGITDPVEMVLLEWRDPTQFASRVKIAESGEEIPLPQQDIITFGRLRDQSGISANDVVLSLPDPSLSQQVSRWHFELRRRPDGFVLRSVTDQTTDVDGKPLLKGEEIGIKPGSAVRVARVMTLEFLGDADAIPGGASADATAYKIK